MSTPYEMGMAGYANGIGQPVLDDAFMASMEGQPASVLVEAHKEWTRGYADAHLEATVFGSWDWGAAARKVEKFTPPDLSEDIP